ncbi:MAG: hypothetical protein ACW97A_01375 [Candidatus Thorarchaeota archaeon]
MPRSENASLVVSPQVVVGMVRDAHEYYIENRIDERYESMALDLIRRYVSQEGVPRELDSLFAAALYVVTRHPWSYPNPLTKTEFASKLRMKESSLEWHTDNITEKLGFATLRDKNQLPLIQMVPLQASLILLFEGLLERKLLEELSKVVSYLQTLLQTKSSTVFAMLSR